MVDADVGLGGGGRDGSPALVAPPGVAALQLLVEGGWSWRAMPALETRATQQSLSGLARGVQGIGCVGSRTGPAWGGTIQEAMGLQLSGQLLVVGRLADQRLVLRDTLNGDDGDTFAGDGRARWW